MPAAVVAVASYAASTYVAGAVVAAGYSAFAGAVIGGLAAAATSIVVGSAMGLNKQAPQQSVQDIARGVLINSASTVDPLMVVYGRRRMGGTRVFCESSGDSNEYLHLIIAHCEGPIYDIEQVYLDEVAVTDSKFDGLVTVEKFTGADNQAACQSLIDALPAKWTSAHKLAGVAYTYLRLKYDQKVFNGLPNVTVDIKGRTVFDPRTGTTAWSDNPPVCIRDYLTNARYGRGIASIDDAAFIAAANASDVTISGLKTYTCNGVVNTDQNSADNTISMMSSCRGMLVFSAKGYALLIDKAEVPSAFAFNEDNITGAWTFAPGGKRTRYNRVRGNWFNPDRSWQPDIYPADSTAFRAIDNGLLLESQLELPFTTVYDQANRLTDRHLKQSRFGMVSTFRAFIAGMFCEVGDVVPISHSMPGWVNKPFRIMRISLLSTDEVEVEVREYDDSVYVQAALTAPRATPVTNLPDPLVVITPGVPSISESMYITSNSVGVRSRATVSWTVMDAFAVSHQVEYQLQGSSSWTPAAQISDKTVDIDDLAEGRYYFRVRSLNTLGRFSDWAVAPAEILGLTAAPADITGFAVLASNGMAFGAWNLTPDLDVRIGGRIVVRWSPLMAAAQWENGIPVAEFSGASVTGSMPMLTGTYMIKAKDSTGNWSSNIASWVLTAGQITALPNSQTLIESPAYLGVKTSVVNDSGALKLDAMSMVDAIPGLVDSWPGWIDSQGGVAASGTYDVSQVMDFGSVATRRFTSVVAAQAFDTGEYIDSRGMVDTWGMVDGGVINDATVQLLASLSQDGVIYGAWFPLMAADLTCQSAKFRLSFTAAAPTHNVTVSQLSITANW
jgi:hypothetical protein